VTGDVFGLSCIATDHDDAALVFDTIAEGGFHRLVLNQEGEYPHAALALIDEDPICSFYR